MIDTPEPITFQQLLARHGRIAIPRLQRDYAQGRAGVKEAQVREAFLEVLRKALERQVDAEHAPQNLDFIYGTAETSPYSHFSPLDGQQRLTTLFLLHWLLAWRDGDDSWHHFTTTFSDGEYCCFSYSVRTSSKEFFDQLVQHRPPMPASELEDLKGWITDQSWYFLYWRLDPTIQGVLKMLQAMHKFFAGRHVGKLYARLTDQERPAITFQLLNLGSFPLADDLYIKMNARGKPLTPFENFKGRYEEKLPQHFPHEARRHVEGVAFALPEFVALRMDTGWTDFFWKHQIAHGKPDPERLDEAFMNVFRIVALISRDPESETYGEDIKLLRDEKNPPVYATFEARGWLDAAFSRLLVSLMETWCAAGASLLPDSPYEEQQIFLQVLENPAKLTVTQVLLFTGYALYIQQHEAALDRAKFADWMRVVHNLGVNSDIDSNDLLAKPSQTLRELLPHSLVILPHIQSLGGLKLLAGFSELAQREEALKAGLLLADPAGWHPLIRRAERHGYFRGQIGFLLDFSGVQAEAAGRPDCLWDASTHLRLQQSFLSYLEKAEDMFDIKGLVDPGEKRWQRALLSLGNYLQLRGSTNFSFLENDRSEPFSWKNSLRHPERRGLLQQLWDHLTHGRPLPAQLDGIIAAASGLEPWREAFVKSAAAVKCCCTLQRDWAYENQVYLLKTTQRKGWHAELFTYVLQDQLRHAHARQPFTPLSIGEYHYSRLKDEPPFLPLHIPWEDAQLTLRIEGWNAQFKLCIQLPPQHSLLPRFSAAGFAESAPNSGLWFRQVDRSDIETELRKIAAFLIAP